MKRHYLGLILFVFIVGSSAAITGQFRSSMLELRTDFRCRNHKEYKENKCRGHNRRKHDVAKRVTLQIQQAVFNTNSNLFTVRHRNCSLASEMERELVYHFYVKDASGTRHVKAARFSGCRESSHIISDLDWLPYSWSKGNLYVASESLDSLRDWRIAPDFANSGAIPVLVNRGK